jgi:predicted regulator of amino acid metabolism with ACT domain
MSSKKGFLLLEITVTFMLICILFATFYQSFLQILGSMRKIYDDLELSRVALSITAIVEREMLYDSSEVILQENNYGSRMVCKNIGPNRTVMFYCSNIGNKTSQIVAYKSTQITGRAEGINPISSPNVSVVKWHSEKIDGRTLRLEIELKMEKTGRSKTFIEVIRLCNGYVI